jgi:hypothetical protein
MVQYKTGYKFVGETRLKLGEALPRPDPSSSDPEMDLEEPIYLPLMASSALEELPVGLMVP